MDILPSIPDPKNGRETAIAITNKQGVIYSWSGSDPQGYGIWFDARNQSAFSQVVSEQKRLIFSREPAVFARIEDVPNQLVRTSLQRSTQIMKRHRDVMFNNNAINDYRPISMIITTLAGHLYSGESDIFDALAGIVSQLQGHAVLMQGALPGGRLSDMALIRRLPNERWYIANPVNPEENFADRWHEDNHARARAFFQWVARIKEDLIDILGDGRRDPSRTLAAALGVSPSSTRLGLVAPETPTFQAPRIQISETARPWRV